MSHSNDIGCLEAIELLYAYLDDELQDDNVRDQVAYHLDHCRSCYSRSQMETALNRHLESTSSQAPDALRRRMKKLMDDF